MSILCRVSAALSALLLLQLSLLGSGTLCALQRTARAWGAGMVAMPGMASHQAASPSRLQHASNAEHSSAPTRCDAKSSAADCGLPWSPGACTAMTAGATIVAPAVASLTPLDRAVSPSELPAPAQLRTGPADSPEIPPPRA